MKRHLLLFVSLIFIGNVSFSQNRASCILGDTIKLNINNFRGSVTWQESVDNQNYTDIIGSSTQLRYMPTTTSKWVRAKIEEENCPPFYEVPFVVSAVDTSLSGYQRNNLSVEQLPAEFVSEESNGLLIFDLDANEFPLAAGDWLAGFAQQQTMKEIDAIIIQDGLAKVYTSLSNVSVYAIPLNFGNPTTGKVMGRVLNEAGEIVIAAKVKMGTDSVYTDFNGVFILNDVAMFDKMGYLTVTKNGFFDGSRTFIPKQNGTVVEIRLLRKNLAGNFNSTAGGTVSLENVQLQFPPNSITRNGVLFNGNVKVFVNYINPESQQFFQEMPGNLIGNQNGNLRGLTSFGMIGVEMIDSLGNDLQIAVGQTVTTSFPLSNELLANAPDTIDLWSYNETQGIWIDEGEAIKNGNNYVAQLPHFSFWNCDFPSEVVFLDGIITDENGNPISGANVTLSTATIGNASDLTNNLGQFGGFVPINTELNISLNYTCGTTGVPINLLSDLIIGPFNIDTTLLLQNLAIPNMNSLMGSVQNCENLPLENGYVISGNVVTFLEQGNFMFNTCLLVDSIRIVKDSPFEYGAWQTLSLNPGLNDLGILTLCGGDTLLTDTVSDIDGNVYRTVLIGDIWWMAENLKVSKYSNGVIIPNLIDSLAWRYTTSSAWCDYGNLPANSDIYGKLYNGYTCIGTNNLCPIGWHIPSKIEWLETIAFAGGAGIAGGRLKSFESWNQPNTGASNVFGFSALGAGTRTVIIPSFSIVYYQMGIFTLFWTSTPGITPESSVWGAVITSGGANISINNPFFSWGGGSVRCVKD